MGGCGLSRMQTWIKGEVVLVFLSSVHWLTYFCVLGWLTFRCGNVLWWNASFGLESFDYDLCLSLFPVDRSICQLHTLPKLGRHTLPKLGRCQMMSKQDRK